MSTRAVLFETRGPVAHIRLNRPEALNAFNGSMFDEFNAAIDRFRDDSALRVAILSGVGTRAFSAGVDLKEVNKHLASGENRVPRVIELASPGYLDKPVIAAIRGYCVGEGVHVALACDFRVCASDAIFSVPEVAVGIPLIRLTSQAVQTIGLPAAIELCYLAEKKDAAWALQHQLVHRVALPGEEMAAAEAIARRLCEVSFPALRATKRTAWKALDLSYDEVFRFGLTLREAVLASGDATAATAAFIARTEASA